MTFRSFFALAALLAVAAVPSGARGADCLAYLAADAAHERDRISAEKAMNRVRAAAQARYERAADTARSRASKAKKSAEIGRSEAYAAAGRRFASARNAAYAVYDRSLPPGACRSITPRGRKLCNPAGKDRRIEKAAGRKYDRTLRPARSARDKARRAADRVYRRALTAARKIKDREVGEARAARRSAVTPQALDRAIPALAESRRAREDAYIAAYANPGPYRRNVGRYERAIVLKAARHERKRQCPR